MAELTLSKAEERIQKRVQVQHNKASEHVGDRPSATRGLDDVGRGLAAFREQDPMIEEMHDNDKHEEACTRDCDLYGRGDQGLQTRQRFG